MKAKELHLKLNNQSIEMDLLYFSMHFSLEMEDIYDFNDNISF